MHPRRRPVHGTVPCFCLMYWATSSIVRSGSSGSSPKMLRSGSTMSTLKARLKCPKMRSTRGRRRPSRGARPDRQSTLACSAARRIPAQLTGNAWRWQRRTRSPHPARPRVGLAMSNGDDNEIKLGRNRPMPAAVGRCRQLPGALAGPQRRFSPQVPVRATGCNYAAWKSGRERGAARRLQGRWLAGLYCVETRYFLL